MLRFVFVRSIVMDDSPCFFHIFLYFSVWWNFSERKSRWSSVVGCKVRDQVNDLGIGRCLSNARIVDSRKRERERERERDVLLSARSRDTGLRINLVTRNLECPAVFSTFVRGGARACARMLLSPLCSSPFLRPFWPRRRLQIARAISLFPRRFHATRAAYQAVGSVSSSRRVPWIHKSLLIEDLQAWAARNVDPRPNDQVAIA